MVIPVWIGCRFQVCTCQVCPCPPTQGVQLAWRSHLSNAVRKRNKTEPPPTGLQAGQGSAQAPHRGPDSPGPPVLTRNTRRSDGLFPGRCRPAASACRRTRGLFGGREATAARPSCDSRRGQQVAPLRRRRELSALPHSLRAPRRLSSPTRSQRDAGPSPGAEAGGLGAQRGVGRAWQLPRGSLDSPALGPLTWAGGAVLGGRRTCLLAHPARVGGDLHR